MQYNAIINKLKPCCTSCEHWEPQTMQGETQLNPDEVMLAVEVSCHHQEVCGRYAEKEDET